MTPPPVLNKIMVKELSIAFVMPKENIAQPLKEMSLGYYAVMSFKDTFLRFE